MLSKQPQDEKVDVWALGCILYEMVTFSHAFSSTSAIQRGEFAPLPPDLPAELVQTITRLLQPNPADWPSVAELFDLPAVRCRLQEWPYPVMLDTPSPPPTRLAPLSRAVLEARPAATGAAEAEAEAAGTAAAAAGFGALGTPVPRGTPVWAKHGSDGLWHRGVVQTSVDSDSYLVQYPERQCVDTAWFDGLRPYGAPGAEAGPRGAEAEGCRDDLRPDSAAKSAVERRGRSVRWIDALSDAGDKGASARGSASASGAPATGTSPRKSESTAKALSFTNQTFSSRGDFSRTTGGGDGLGDDRLLLSSPLSGAGASGVGLPAADTTVRSSACMVL